jgi:hypothetical protein
MEQTLFFSGLNFFSRFSLLIEVISGIRYLGSIRLYSLLPLIITCGVSGQTACEWLYSRKPKNPI